MSQLVHYAGPKSFSSAKGYDWRNDLSTTQKRLSPLQENHQLKGEWAPVVCHKVAVPDRKLTGLEGHVTVTEESTAGQERLSAALEERLVVPGSSTEVQEQSLVILELSPTGPDRSHANQGRSRTQDVSEQPLVFPGLSTFAPEISFTDPEQSLFFPEPSYVSPELSLAGQGQSHRLPELSHVVPEQSAANPERSQIPTGEPGIPFQPTSPPVHQWTWITSSLRPNLLPPKSTLTPPLFREVTLSQSVPASTLASQQYPKTVSAQPQAPPSSGSTGTNKSAGGVKSQPHECKAFFALKVDSGLWHHGPYFVLILQYF